MSRSAVVPTEGSSVPARVPAADSLYAHGFGRVAAAVPRVRVGDVAANTARTIELLQAADADHAALVVFPELGLVGYSSQDLLHQEAFLDAALQGLDQVRAATGDLRSLAVVGAPLRIAHALFNVAVVLHRGA